MKKSNNNFKQIFRTVTFAVLVMLVAVIKLSATENNGDSLKAKKEVSKEETMMIQDLLIALEEIDELDNSLPETAPTVEVYGANDELLFSGTQANWDAQNTTAQIALKRKAELLFEVDGTSIYKVF